MGSQIRMPTGSSLEQADACPASHVLPQCDHPAGSGAQTGTTVHRFAQRYVKRWDRETALAEVPVDDPARSLCENFPVESIPVGSRCEVAYAYDPETTAARELGEDLDRGYAAHGLARHEIGGTADLVAILNDDTVLVLDWKTSLPIYLPTVTVSRQLRFLALAACRAYGLTKAKVGYWFISADGFREEIEDLDVFDLAEIASQVRRTVARIVAAQAEETPNVAMGDQCRWCRSKEYCPAQRATIGALVHLSTTPLTRKQVGEAYLFWEQVKDRMHDIEEAFKAFAREAPLELPDGRVLREIQVEKDSLDTDIAYAVLHNRFSGEVADTAMEKVITKASITRALRKVAGRGELASMERDALRAIGLSGGITTRTESQVKVTRVRKAG